GAQTPLAQPGPASKPATPGTGSATAPSSTMNHIVVKRGDSLWTIAAEALGPLATDVEISQAWPQWYRANFSTIGNDPSFLLPGQVLRAP
ncbi:MAG: LysM peptidoglycan-binding domain-containing protein, partial [Acidobacteria bacterium]|nr:LysM peptidoglycan-binding domain-containing protein [Acidobacteriota bacterium]